MEIALFCKRCGGYTTHEVVIRCIRCGLAVTTDVPICFGLYSGDEICVKCEWVVECLETTYELEELFTK